MAITEQSRYRLRIYLEETMGEEQASAMMDHLLPVGWTDLATSAEVAQLRDWATIRFERVDERFDQVATVAAMERGFRRQTWSLVTAMCAINGLTIAAMRLVGVA